MRQKEKEAKEAMQRATLLWANRIAESADRLNDMAREIVRLRADNAFAPAEAGLRTGKEGLEEEARADGRRSRNSQRLPRAGEAPSESHAARAARRVTAPARPSGAPTCRLPVRPRTQAPPSAGLRLASTAGANNSRAEGASPDDIEGLLALTRFPGTRFPNGRCRRRLCRFTKI